MFTVLRSMESPRPALLEFGFQDLAPDDQESAIESKAPVGHFIPTTPSSSARPFAISVLQLQRAEP